MKRAAVFFSREEQERIQAAVAAAEQRTSGEIVPMVIDASSDYRHSALIAAGSFAMGTALLLAWGVADSSEWAFFGLFLLCFYPALLLLRALPGLRRRLIPPAEIETEVRERALIAFVEQNVYQTCEGTGILILLSLFEHRVYFLADAGINTRVGPEIWSELAQSVALGIRDDRAADALCNAISRCGEILAKEFPRRSDDVDELPNLILGR